MAKLLTCVILLLVGGCAAQPKHTPQQEKAVLEFDFEGVNFSTPLAQFLKQHPDCKESGDENDKALGKRILTWKPHNADFALAIFLDNDLYHLAVFYDINGMGFTDLGAGFQQIQSKLQDKFGIFDKMVEKPLLTLTWNFDNVNRRVSYDTDFHTGRASMMIFNTSLYQKEDERKKAQASKVNTGL